MPRSAQSKAIREELRKAIDRDGVKAEITYKMENKYYYRTIKSIEGCE